MDSDKTYQYFKERIDQQSEDMRDAYSLELGMNLIEIGTRILKEAFYTVDERELQWT